MAEICSQWTVGITGNRVFWDTDGGCEHPAMYENGFRWVKCEYIKTFAADSLAYLSLEGMMQAIGSQTGYCNACFTGMYPMEINPGSTKTGFEYGISS